MRTYTQPLAPTRRQVLASAPHRSASRVLLRLDGVIVRLRDTRVYIEHDSNKVVRQYTAKEGKYDVVAEKLRSMRNRSVPELFRDPNVLAPLLDTVDDVIEVFEVH